MIGSVSPFLLSQILAAGAFVLGLGAFQFAAKRSVFLAMAASALLKSLHFFLLACPEAGVLMLVVASRFTAGIFTVSRLAMYFYIAVSLVVFAATYQGALAWLALLGALLVAVSSFQRSDRTVRLLIMAGTSCWVVHNAIAASPVGTLMELAFLGSNMVGYWRFYQGR